MTRIDDDLNEIFGDDDDDATWLGTFRNIDDETPTTLQIEEYDILGEVARGGQGIVYRARERSTNREVALKRLPVGASARARNRFEREVLATARLRHPNIVTIYGLTRRDDDPVIVMEWIDGKTIDEWVLGETGSRRSKHEILEVFAKICDATHHAHGRGVLHRDLKPSNILIDRESGEPKIVDFGIAKELDGATTAGGSRLTRTSEFFGTIRYASPEQVQRGTRDVSVTSEVYMLGVLLYELIAGRLPYDLGDSLEAAVDAIARKDPARLTPTTGDKSNWELEVVLNKALEKDPSRRYADASELRDDIRRQLAGEPIRAAPYPRLYRAGKFVVRHRSMLLAGATILALATVLMTSSREVPQTKNNEILDDLFAQVATFADPAAVQKSVPLLRHLLFSDPDLTNEDRIVRHHRFGQAYTGRGFPNIGTVEFEAALDLGAKHGFPSADVEAAVWRDYALALDGVNESARAFESIRSACNVPQVSEVEYYRCRLLEAWFAHVIGTDDDGIEMAQRIQRPDESRLGPVDRALGMRVSHIGTVLQSEDAYNAEIATHESSLAELVELPATPLVVFCEDILKGGIVAILQSRPDVRRYQQYLSDNYMRTKSERGMRLTALAHVLTLYEDLAPAEYDEKIAVVLARLVDFGEIGLPLRIEIERQRVRRNVFNGRFTHHEAANALTQALADAKEYPAIVDQQRALLHHEIGMHLSLHARTLADADDQHRTRETALDHVSRGLSIIERTCGKRFFALSMFDNSIGKICLELGQHTEALAAYARATKRLRDCRGEYAPFLGLLLLHRGDTESAMGAVDDAANSYRECLEHVGILRDATSWIEAHVGLSFCLRASGKHDESDRVLAEFFSQVESEVPHLAPFIDSIIAVRCQDMTQEDQDRLTLELLRIYGMRTSNAAENRSLAKFKERVTAARSRSKDPDKK
ncbi:MAG: protein kinase [Planctomycetes bacterium]|nr:protein kinase [Planctomycetota bacterium]MCB9919528.1 protein kinase [Planctomycetota bacterium]